MISVLYFIRKISAQYSIKTNNININGSIIDGSIVLGFVKLILAGWWRVVHHSTEYLIIGILLIYLVFSYKVIQKINLLSDERIKLVLIGSISIILLQTFVHIGVNIRLLPTTGMTLPYLSYGGSSIMSTAIISGIILNLTKRKVS